MLSNSEIKYDSEFMARALRAVADPARLRLLRLCSDQPTSVSELAAATAESEPNVSRQLKQLALAGLLRRVRRGQRVEYLPVAEIGFSRDLLGLLLQRLDPDDAALREARVRLRAIEVAARNPALLRAASHEWLQTGRLGRTLRVAIEAELKRDLVGARVLARTQHRELLEALSSAEVRLTLRARDKHELALLKAWSQDQSAEIEIRANSELRQQERFDVVLDLPLPGEVKDAAQLASLISRARTQLVDDGILWCAIPYELLEQGGGAPPTRLRALLQELAFDCQSLIPLEAEGRHLLVFRARARARRAVVTPAVSLSA
ncbi:MAG: ArsR/SmtB family transcription factor [Steroidobacteraceae bacterium]|jgi:ArsR family transcriptional regulator